MRPNLINRLKKAMKRLTRDDTEHGVEYYRADEVDALLADQPAQVDGDTIVQTFTGLPRRKLRDLLSGGWEVNGVCFQRIETDGTVRRGAATTGGMVLWWNAEQPAQQQEPVAWMPIEQMYPQSKAIDILMGDGSILCAVLPQFDGDLWWEGSGTGEKFIDPKYANVTHWRIHDERTSPPAQRKPLTDEQIRAVIAKIDPNEHYLPNSLRQLARAIEAAHGIKKNT